MLYIVEVPEARQEDLLRALKAINPRAEPPVAVGMNEDNRMGLLWAAEVTYEDEIAGEMRSKGVEPTPWSRLGEEARMGVAGWLAGSINWQFGGMGPLNLDDLDGLIERRPEIAGSGRTHGKDCPASPERPPPWNPDGSILSELSLQSVLNRAVWQARGDARNLSGEEIDRLAPSLRATIMQQVWERETPGLPPRPRGGR